MISTTVLEAAISTYNEYRSPMATAELLETTGSGFVVQFEGPFCRMCCDYDYFEDLIYELDEYGEDPTVIDITEIRYEGGEQFIIEFTTRTSPRKYGPSETPNGSEE